MDEGTRHRRHSRSASGRWATIRYAIGGGWGRTLRLVLILVVMQSPVELALWNWHPAPAACVADAGALYTGRGGAEPISVPGTCGGSYQTDEHGGSARQLTLRCPPDSLRTHMQGVKLTVPGPHGCP